LVLPLALAQFICSFAGSNMVVEKEGARVFLDQGAAVLLEDKVLDGSLVGNGVDFSFAERDATTAQ
jgi:hypothetical protein